MTVILLAGFLNGMSTNSLNIIQEVVGAFGVAMFGYLTVICAVKSQA